MTRFGIVAILLLIASAHVGAQTATPTPLAPTIGQTIWRAKDIVAPNFYVSGFSLTTTNNRQALTATASGSQITFWVYKATDIVIWYQHIAGGKANNTVCLNWTGCTAFSTASNGGGQNDPALVPFALRTFDYSAEWTSVTISTVNSVGTLAIEAVQVLTGYYPTATPFIYSSPTPASTATITPTPTNTSTPTPAPWVDATLAPSGQMTRFEYVASASDVHLSNLMTMILLSSWGMFFLWLFIGRNRK